MHSARADRGPRAFDRIVKRGVDFTLATIGLVVLSPAWAVLAVAIKLEDGGPVFFTQERWGRGRRRIVVRKFRSMAVHAADRAVQAATDDARITRVGRVMRATALDESPQLLSIWKGDMSFVGPRALPINEVQAAEHEGAIPDEMIPGFTERLMVKPGLTGIAQVYAARDVGRRHKFRYDRFYIGRQCLRLDLYLILLSVWISVRGKWESRGTRRRRQSSR